MKLELTQKLQQQQILAPQMILSMDILLLNAQELELRIERELAENPVLEVEEPAPEKPPASPALQPAGEAKPVAGENFVGVAEFETEGRRSYYDLRPRRGDADSDADKQAMLQNTAGRPPGLKEFLLEQIRTSGLEANIRAIAEELVQNLDHRGYLLGSPDEVFSSLGRRCTKEEFDRALTAVRRLDPPGVGAEDLRQCLLLQLERDRQSYPIETQIILHHLDDLAQNRIPKIAKEIGATVDDIKDAVSVIASLNPIPGRGYDDVPTIYVRPEVVVEADGGQFRVRVDDGYLPRLAVSDYYRTLLQQSRDDPQISSFLRKKVESAQWLIQAIHQRQRTLRDIAQAMVEYQSDFMKEGPEHLRAMRMQTIADRVGVHISTISRAIKGKYMQTPWGVYDMRYFFTGGVARADGEIESRRNLYRMIGDIIASEDKRRPYSDSKVARILRERGFSIARRTVTKYREQEGIPSSRLRRSY